MIEDDDHNDAQEKEKKKKCINKKRYKTKDICTYSDRGYVSMKD